MHAKWTSSLAAIIVILALSGVSRADEIEAVQKRYAALRDFTATFTQETFQALAGKKVRFEGTVSYKKGTGVRMDVSVPERQILILKGSTVLVVLPDEGTSQVQDVPAEIASQNILGFFSGIASLEEFYTLQDLGESIVLVPKNGSGSITVRVDRDHLIRRIHLKDALGNTSDVSLDSYMFNRGLPEGLFRTEAAAHMGEGAKKRK
ncbi:MAG TPA: outer membrane lipoprotein carrier protein LolA [Deltaproteobacteria bacterium]|nr:outer membrane lipoprotein carrier protein LolA [Deltaproteobacteria bacterium]